MLRALVLLLVLLASSTPPEVAMASVSRGVSEVAAAELSSAQLAVFDANRAPLVATPVDAPPPDPRRPLLVPGRAWTAPHTQVVVLLREPRIVPAARAASLRDQRPALRRLRRHARHLDEGPPATA